MSHGVNLFLTEFHTDTLMTSVKDDSWQDEAESKGLEASLLTMSRVIF